MKCKRAPEAACYIGRGEERGCVKRVAAPLNKRKINARTNKRPTANKIVPLARANHQRWRRVVRRMEEVGGGRGDRNGGGGGWRKKRESRRMAREN